MYLLTGICIYELIISLSSRFFSWIRRQYVSMVICAFFLQERFPQVQPWKSAITKRKTLTFSSWPIRWALAIDWSSTAGFQWGLVKYTSWKCWRFSPSHAVWICTTSTSGPRNPLSLLNTNSLSRHFLHTLVNWRLVRQYSRKFFLSFFLLGRCESKRRTASVGQTLIPL